MQPQPTYEQLATLVVRQAAVIESLQERVAALEAEVASLRRQLGPGLRAFPTVYSAGTTP